MTTELRDAAWVRGFIGRHIDRSILEFHGPRWDVAMAEEYPVRVTPVEGGHEVEVGEHFKVVHGARGAWVAWTDLGCRGLLQASKRQVTRDVRRLLRRHGVLAPVTERRTA